MKISPRTPRENRSYPRVRGRARSASTESRMPLRADCFFQIKTRLAPRGGISRTKRGKNRVGSRERVCGLKTRRMRRRWATQHFTSGTSRILRPAENPKSKFSVRLRTHTRPPRNRTAHTRIPISHDIRPSVGGGHATKPPHIDGFFFVPELNPTASVARAPARPPRRRHHRHRHRAAQAAAESAGAAAAPAPAGAERRIDVAA